MIVSKIEEELNYKIEEVWRIVTNNQEYSWRSDLSKIEILDEINFVEYTLKGFPTYFKITNQEENKVYEFTMENANLKGHWIGRFVKIGEKQTKLILQEEIEVSNFIMKLLTKGYLKKQQERYLKDLKKKLEEEAK